MEQRKLKLPPQSNDARARDPRTYFSVIRAQGPVVNEGGEPLVVDGRLVEEIASNPKMFSSRGNIAFGRERPIIPQQTDAPDHMRYRKLLMPLVSPARMGLLRPALEESARKLVDAVVDQGHCELGDAFATPLPCDAFLGLLGIPLADKSFLLDFKDAVMKPQNHPGSYEEQVARQTSWAAQGDAYFSELIAERRRKPGEDFISGMLSAEFQGQKLTDEEILDICFQLPLAGLDTVTAAIMTGWDFLARHPEYQAMIAARPEIAKTAVEELLRLESPVHGLKRLVVSETSVGGCPFAAGDRILLSTGAANGDPERFERPQEANLERYPNRHLTFGVGPHTCLGNNLARMEMQIALVAWHERIPNYRIKQGAEIKYSDDNMIRHIDHLPLEW